MFLLLSWLYDPTDTPNLPFGVKGVYTDFVLPAWGPVGIPPLWNHRRPSQTGVKLRGVFHGVSGEG